MLSVAPDLLDRMLCREESLIGFHFDGAAIKKGWSPAATESLWWLPRATHFRLSDAGQRLHPAASGVFSEAADSNLPVQITLPMAEVLAYLEQSLGELWCGK